MKKIIVCLLILTVCFTANVSAQSRRNRANANPFDEIVNKSFENLTKSPRLVAGSRMALMPVAGDQSIAREIYDMMTTTFFNSFLYDMVERDRLDAILKEQNFQYGGLVDDNTAVEIGKLLGAQVIVIGDIPANESSRRLVFRALDVQTGRILAISSERF